MEYISHAEEEKTASEDIAAVFDRDYYYRGADLGWYDGTVRVWAPAASGMNLLIYDDMLGAESDFYAPVKSMDGPVHGNRVPMVRREQGIWLGKVPEGSYYMYEIDNSGVVYRVCDIYAAAASPDSVAALAADINSPDSGAVPAGWGSYTNPFGNADPKGIAHPERMRERNRKRYTEAVIFEMHIRDWSRAFFPGSTGKFADITAALGGCIPPGNGFGDGTSFGAYLKDLGVTHVQLLPVFDYAQKNSDPSYNWGYNPYHYNVPEGRYVNGHEKGAENAVFQMREMVQAFHNAGIAVIMDVVYNHTSGTGAESLYDMTVPGYYYRPGSNGSGTGNETASNAQMFRKYMIDSLVHWMRDYHINGFRFDLMGLHETDTMKDIYNALKKIDPNVMVYGEPWTGGPAAVIHGVTKEVIDDCTDNLAENGVACFNDDFRNAVKGSDFGCFGLGSVQGAYGDDALITGLCGSHRSAGGFTGVIGRSVNYVECHDNYTLADKLSISLIRSRSSVCGSGQSDWQNPELFSPDEQRMLKAENTLAAAFVFLAQGTPFINGGQEFLRTKKGDENSYMSGDDINGIDLSFVKKYGDVRAVYKGLIALRQSAPAFTAGKDVQAVRVADGVIRYTADNYLVYFNATADSVPADTGGYAMHVSVETGTVLESTDIPASVPAKGFIVLRR
ncbi:MAG: alpha-amylase [Spirochaetaceae bacterium]|nr:alpha-amylase [Spirochaetaceae bacterium]